MGMLEFLLEAAMSVTSKSSEGTIRVVLCSYQGIFSTLVTQTLQKTAGIELVGLVCSKRIFSKSETWLQGAVRLLKTSGFDYMLLQYIQTDLYLGLKKLFCTQGTGKIQTLKTKDINDSQGIKFLTALNPDVILLANFNQKVSASIINSAKLACLNIHPSLLPQFKGVDPVFAALNTGQTLLGVSVHYVTEEFDSGDLLAQATLTVEKNHSVLYHQIKLFQQGALLAAQSIGQLPAGIKTQRQTGEGSYDSWPRVLQIRAFKKRGGFLVKYTEFMSVLKTTESR